MRSRLLILAFIALVVLIDYAIMNTLYLEQTAAVFIHTFVNLQMMAKFAEDDRIEQMNAQKRRMKQLEHKKAVEQLLVDRQEQFARERVSIGGG